MQSANQSNQCSNCGKPLSVFDYGGYCNNCAKINKNKLNKSKNNEDNINNDKLVPSWACKEDTGQHAILCDCKEFTDSIKTMKVTIKTTKTFIFVYHTTGHYVGSKPLFAKSGEYYVHLGNYKHPEGKNNVYKLEEYCPCSDTNSLVRQINGRDLEIVK